MRRRPPRVRGRRAPARVARGASRRRAATRRSSPCHRTAHRTRRRAARTAARPARPARADDRAGAGRAAGHCRRKTCCLALLALEAEGARDARRVHRRRRGRMVRPPPAGAHAPPHARQAARRVPAGAAGAVHALPVPLAPAGDSDADDERREGEGGLADVLRQLEGHAAPAAAWEDDLLAARVADYEPAMLDRLCAVGRVVWWRPTDAADAASAAARSAARRSCSCERDALPHWQQAAGASAHDEPPLSEQGARGAGGAAHARRQLLRRPAARRRPARRRRSKRRWPSWWRKASSPAIQLRRPARAGDAGRTGATSCAAATRAASRSTTPAAGR